MYSITVRNNILIAHSLPGEVFGPAQNMHGATYLVDAEFFTDKLNEYNIIMDLGVVTTILKDTLKVYNYKNLDDLDEFKGILTTTEFMAQQIVNHFIEIAKNNSIDISKLFSIKVTLNESHIAAASYEKNLNE